MRISDWSSDVCASDLHIRKPRSRSGTRGAPDMADIDSRIEAADRVGVTTGPIRGSRKVHVASPTGSDIRVAMREIDLDPHSGEPSARVYDTSGPYTDANTSIDINAGLPELRAAWIRSRGDVEEVSQREVRPEDNGQLGPDRSGGVPAFPAVRKTVLRARGGATVRTMHYARPGSPTRTDKHSDGQGWWSQGKKLA